MTWKKNFQKNLHSTIFSIFSIFYKYKIVLWKFVFATSKIRAMQIRAMRIRASRGMTIIQLGLHIINLFRFCSPIKTLLQNCWYEYVILLNDSGKTPFLSFLSNYQAENFYVILSQKKNTWKYIDFEWIPLNSTKFVKHRCFLNI